VGGDAQVWAIALGLPGPVDAATGRVVAPPIMPGWDGFDVRAWFQPRWDVPVWVDNEVNLMALGEWERGVPQERRDLLYVKVATGIGSGLVTGGLLHRGDTGAAGDIGHVRVTDDPAAVCRCGKTGCLEAVASGWALVRTLTERARAGESPVLAARLADRGRLVAEDIGAATAAGDEVALSSVTEAARVTGTAIAGVVNFANPGTLVLGGGVLRTGRLFFDEFRRAVLAGAIELAARNLTIRTASLHPDEGAVGGAVLAARNLFAPQALQIWLANGTPVGSAQRLQGAA
jgi:predicted NBD/HSP70 family sugar kinase